MTECQRPHAQDNQLGGYNIPYNHFLIIDDKEGTARLWQRLGPRHASIVSYPESYLERWWQGYNREPQPA